VQAVFAQNAELIVGIPKNDQIFPEEPGAHRRAVGQGNLLAHAHRQPVAPRHLAHHRLAFDPAEDLVLRLG
jgi:hypothetical protein